MLVEWAAGSGVDRETITPAFRLEQDALLGYAPERPLELLPLRRSAVGRTGERASRATAVGSATATPTVARSDSGFVLEREATIA